MYYFNYYTVTTNIMFNSLFQLRYIIILLRKMKFYLDLIFSVDEPNTFNLLKIAGSSLGTKYSNETKVKMGKSKSVNTRTKMSFT